MSNDLILSCCGLKRHQPGCRSAARVGTGYLTGLTGSEARWKTEHEGDTQFRVLLEPSEKCWVFQGQAIWSLALRRIPSFQSSVALSGPFPCVTLWIHGQLSQTDSPSQVFFSFGIIPGWMGWNLPHDP